MTEKCGVSANTFRGVNELVPIVLDTNVVVSAAIRAGGIPALIVSAGIERKFDIYLSLPILNEYREVLSRGKFGLPLKIVDD